MAKYNVTYLKSIHLAEPMIVPPLCIIQLTDDQFASTMCSPPSTIPTKKVKRYQRWNIYIYMFYRKSLYVLFFHFNLYWPVQNCATFLKCSIKISYFYHRTCKQTTFRIINYLLVCCIPKKKYGNVCRKCVMKTPGWFKITRPVKKTKVDPPYKETLG